MSDPASTSAMAYDALPYPSLPRAVTQPDRLAVVARLFGLSPAPPSRCRVLEVGCSDGGNLLATALAHPGAEVVGIDISPAQVEAGRAAARALGATNLRLEVMDLREAAALGTFDYVVAHGLYAWVPPPLQAALLEVIAATLRPQGVAYLGVSVLPGSYSLLALRELLTRRTAGAPDPATRVRVARATVEALAEVAPPATAEQLRATRDLVRRSSDAWVRHELLAEENHPQWFHALARAAAARGLQYLADADLPATFPSNHLDPERLKLFDRLARDPLEREQLLDELVGRGFRRALFVPAGAEVDRQVGPERLSGLSVVARYRRPEAWPDLPAGAHEAFRAEPDEGASGRGDAPPGELRTRHPLARARCASGRALACARAGQTGFGSRAPARARPRRAGRPGPRRPRTSRSSPSTCSSPPCAAWSTCGSSRPPSSRRRASAPPPPPWPAGGRPAATRSSTSSTRPCRSSRTSACCSPRSTARATARRSSPSSPLAPPPATSRWPTATARSSTRPSATRSSPAS
ncbi:MAG: class I SAM-dependent methyltransferase [Planctomycetes bacterium]|nr:class I SAM-dependent methyltransferase [Planctomycetota bacterium]